MNNFYTLLKPVVTEKATAAEKHGKYYFFASRSATKVDIRHAFKKLYGIDAIKVNVMRTAEKSRLNKSRKPTVKKGMAKKVIITVKGKKTVDVWKPKLKA